MSDGLQHSLLRAIPEMNETVVWAPSLDYAVEAVESIQLEQIERLPDAKPGTNGVAGMSAELAAVFDDLPLSAGLVVLEQGEQSDGLMVVVRGELTAYHVFEDGSRERLRRFGAPTIIGESGFITGETRSAQIVAETDGAAKWLPTDRLSELRETQPHLVIELYEYIMVEQAGRVISLSRGLTAS